MRDIGPPLRFGRQSSETNCVATCVVTWGAGCIGSHVTSGSYERWHSRCRRPLQRQACNLSSAITLHQVDVRSTMPSRSSARDRSTHRPPRRSDGRPQERRRPRIRRQHQRPWHVNIAEATVPPKENPSHLLPRAASFTATSSPPNGGDLSERSESPYAISKLSASTTSPTTVACTD